MRHEIADCNKGLIALGVLGMGESLSKLCCCNLGTKEIRILMLGLDNAGKTSKILH